MSETTAVDGTAHAYAADRRHVGSAPVVPAEFWQHPEMQEALQTRHMGKVIRAYRQQGYHGYHGISQELLPAALDEHDSDKLDGHEIGARVLAGLS